MDEPLISTPENNYRFFYAASASSVASLVILLVITGYTAYVSTNVGVLMTDMTEVVDDIRLILPDIEESIKMLQSICKHENFTKTYGSVCGI